MKKLCLLLMLIPRLSWAGNFGSSIEGKDANVSFTHTSAIDSAHFIFAYPDTTNWYDSVFTYPVAWGSSKIMNGAGLDLDSVGVHVVKIRYYSGGAVVGHVVGTWLHETDIRDVNIVSAGDDALGAPAFANTAQYMVYGGAVWVDTVNGTAGTTVGVNGLPGSPVKGFQNAKTIADAIGTNRLCVMGGGDSKITLTLNGYEIIGIGDPARNKIDLNSQDVGGSIFYEVDITGIQGGVRAAFVRCAFEDASLDAVALQCGLRGDITLLGDRDNVFIDCASSVPGAQTPTLIFSGGSESVQFRRYSGGLELSGMGANDSLSFEADGQLIINANCNPNAKISARGMLTITDNKGMTNLTYRATAQFIVDSLLAVLDTLALGFGSRLAIGDTNTNPFQAGTDIVIPDDSTASGAYYSWEADTGGVALTKYGGAVLDHDDYKADVSGLSTHGASDVWNVDTSGAWNDDLTKFGEWNAQAQVGGGGSCPTVGEIADGVWGENDTTVVDTSQVGKWLIANVGTEASCFGSGARTVNIDVKNAADSVAINGFEVDVSDSSSGNFIDKAYTNSNGRTTWSLDDDTYTVHLSDDGWTITTPQYLTVSGDATQTYYATEVTVSPPPTDSVCVVYGYIKDRSGVAIRNAKVKMWIPEYPVKFHDVIVNALEPYEVKTDSDGKFEFSLGLYPNSLLTPSGTLYMFRVESKGFRFEIELEVPLADSYEVSLDL